VTDGDRRGPSGPRAGFWRRFAAALIDGIIVGVAASIIINLFKGVGDAIVIVIGIGYYTYLEGGDTGQTLGKRAMQIRVVDLDDGGPIGYSRGFVRYIGRIISAIVLYLGYLWMLWDQEKQCWHDKFASCVVVPETDYPIS
jgi:uncharacterized RDD family membrane protein YckC